MNEAHVHTAAVSIEEMLRLLQEGESHNRHELYKRMVRTEQLHDFRYLGPLGPPDPA